MTHGFKPQHDHSPGMPRGLAIRLFRSLIPTAERDEVLSDLAAEHAERVRRQGALRARLWLWQQVAGSLSPLARRSWWRAWNGFEPEASRLRPGGFVVESWILDLRYSARRLFSRPAYTLLAVLTLALGVGGTAAIFSIVRTLLLDPLPMTREDEVAVLWFDGSWTQQEFLHFNRSFPGFERMAAYMSGDQTLEQPGQPLRMERGVSTSAEIFEVLGARPYMGRTFATGEDLQGAAPTAVISYGLWQELGADPATVGRQLRMGGVSRTIIGVMPPGFWFPNPTVRVWSAAALTPRDRVGNWTLIGRRSGGGTPDMNGPVKAIAAELGRHFTYGPQWDKTKSPSMRPVRQFLVGDMRTPLLATLAAMGLIFSIACVNIAALMLGQVGGRSTELAVRMALGAGRQRLVQQIVLESLVVGALAGLCGALLAAGVFRTLIRSLPLGALAETATLDWTLLAASMAFALVAASLTALIPSLALSRGVVRQSLATMRTGGISGRGGRLEAALVVAQIALAVLLVAGAALLLRTVENLRAVDPGIRVNSVALVDATMPRELSNEERHQAVLTMLPALERIPGVRAVAASQKIPLRGSGDNFGLEVPGKPEFNNTSTAFRTVTLDYFKAMGIRVLRGRGFEPVDRLQGQPVVVINEAMAAKYFPHEDPVGRTIVTFSDEHPERIIGVVANVAEENLTDAPVPARYMLYEHVPMLLPSTTFVLAGHAPEDVPRLMEAARHAVQREGRQLAVDRTLSLASVFEDSLGAAGRIVSLLALLAGLALTLGAIGVYGMISHYVARRSREYGIRLALGLAPSRVGISVLGRGLRLVALGSAVGIVAAIVLTRLMASLLFGVGATDLVALTAAVAALAAAGGAAAAIPARRASRTDPMMVLREQ